MTTLKPPFRAEDMPGLFKKVVKGAIPAIPKKFSQELHSLIKTLINVDPKK
jgi:NIMA (never in mitosis gene a)-related kinase 1/4/5